MSMDFIVLHGGGQGSWVWEETVAALTLQSGGQARSLALDVPGCGVKRGQDTSVVGFDDIIGELAADIAGSPMREALLVGHSQAGCLLDRIADALPDRIRRLVYVSCLIPDPGLTVTDMVARRVHGDPSSLIGRGFRSRDVPPDERNRAMFCNDMSEAEAARFVAKLGPDQWPRSSYEMRDWNYERPGEIPATYVLCRKDAVLPPIWQKHFAERLHADRLIRIDAAHQVMNTRPHALAEVLLAEARA